MALRVCIHGLRPYPGLISFGGRIVEAPPNPKDVNVHIRLSTPEAGTSFFVTSTDDAIAEPFLSCYLFNEEHAVQSLTVDYEPHHHVAIARFLQRIPIHIQVVPVGLGQSIDTPPLTDLLERSKEEGNKFLRIIPTADQRQIQATFNGYAKAADLYYSALYAMGGMQVKPPSVPILACFSNLLLACLKLKAYDVADGATSIGLVRSCVRDTAVPADLRARCLYRIAEIRELLSKKEEALDSAIAAWHLMGDEEKIKDMVRRLLPEAVSRQASSSDDCMFCLESMTGEGVENQVATLECQHTFHVKCIEPWLRFSNNTCPACRAKYDRKLT